MARVLRYIIFLIIVVSGFTYSTTYFFLHTFQQLLPFSTPIYILSFIGSLAFLIGLLLIQTNPGSASNRIYQYGSIWIGIYIVTFVLALFFLWTALIFDISYTGYVSILIFLLFLSIINIYGLYVSYSHRITYYEVPLSKKHSWENKNIVLITDTHYGNIYKLFHAQKLVKRINSLDPYIVLISGDFFDGPKIDFESIAQEFTKVTAPGGILFVNGNHEEYKNTSAMLQALENAGIQILNNKSVIIDGVKFLGVPYHATEKALDFRKALDDLSGEGDIPTILLKHKPTHHSIIEQYPIDIVVSGHTHAGQMLPVYLAAKIVYGKYTYGMVQKNGLTSITSSGVGTWGPPQNIGSTSEIVVINLLSSSQ